MKLLTGFIRDAKIIILNGKPVVNSFFVLFGYFLNICCNSFVQVISFRIYYHNYREILNLESSYGFCSKVIISHNI